jgi:hypothetical protein
MYKPAITANPVAIVREPFSTTLGIPICNAETTNIEGTGGIFFVDTTQPGKLFLLTARHVLGDRSAGRSPESVTVDRAQI